jgi:acetylornithine deacetylase
MAFTATTDARYIEGPCLCYGPLAGNLHGTDEWVDVESLVQTATVAALATTAWIT